MVYLELPLLAEAGVVRLSGELLRRSVSGCQSVSGSRNCPAELTHAAKMAAGAVKQTGFSC
jgi:hypothetical protein